MTAPSITASQTDFCDTMTRVSVTSELNSGYDTPIPRARISDDTCHIFNFLQKCHKHFVGKTSRAFRKRMYEHKFSVKKDGQVTPVYCHFKSEGHNHRDMLFSWLQWCTPKFENTSISRCRRLELAWIFKLHCLTPTGINQFV